MHGGSLTIVILQHVAVTAVQHTRLAEAERRGMVAVSLAVPARLDANKLHSGIIDERIENPRRVASASDACNHHVGKSFQHVKALLLGFLPDDALEIADHHGKWMWANDRADDVVSVLD